MDFGHFCLALAWILSVFGLIWGVFGAFRESEAAVKSSERALYLCWLTTTLALISLGSAFVQHDYSNAYVWQTSNNAMSTPYLISAIWGGMDGSMLLWAGIMLSFSALFIDRSADKLEPELRRWLAPVLHGANNFFLTVTFFLTNPFRLLVSAVSPLDGRGLNPLLQNPSMLIHPPLLYGGFTGLVLPFALAFAALLSGRLSTNWLHVVRRWTLIAWLFLSLGIILGGNWAYIELGWGGFWAWDPVENASFMPWLIVTALVHSMMVQHRRGMLKLWNVILAILCYALAVFGTFLTRSGIVQSVHSFAESDVGYVFIVHLCSIVVIAAGLIFYRRRDLKPDRSDFVIFSREGLFLVNNLLLLAICFATLWGVMLPVITEALQGTKSVVGPPFFNRVNTPLFLALLFLMIVAPFTAWRQGKLKSVLKRTGPALVAGSLLTIVLILIDRSRIYTALTFGLSLSVLWGVFEEHLRSRRVRSSADKSERTRTRTQRLGGLVVHAGVAVMAISIAASMGYKTEQDLALEVGETKRVSDYFLTLEELTQGTESNYSVLESRVSISNLEGEVVSELYPERRFYFASEEPTTEVALDISPWRDIYLALAGVSAGTDSEMAAVFKVYINPLQVWLWIGGFIMIVGSLIALGASQVRLDENGA